MSGGIGSILSMARTAMSAQQTVLQIASQNMSNAATEGYSRQRVELTEAGATVFSYGSVGNGVTIQGITRARDSVLDAAYRQGSAGASAAGAQSTALSQIQSILGEPSDTGLNAALDKFWGAWSDLSADPTNTAAKSVVKEAGNDVATTLNRYASQLDQLSANNRQGMTVDVARVNELTTHISKLNDQIVAAESGGQTANDLRDARDRDLDELSGLVGAQVVEHQNGSVAVYASGRMLVDGAVLRTVQVDAGNPPTISFGNGSPPIAGMGGKLGAEVTVATQTVPDVMSRLDALASSLVQNVNSIHTDGTVYSGSPATASPAGNFFDVTSPAPSGTDPRMTARGIRLSPTLTTSGVATAGASSTGPGNNDTSLALANLRDSMVSFTNADGTTETAKFGDFYGEAVGHVATMTQQAQDDATVQQTLTSNADTRRQSVSSVNTDDELIKVIQAQHAYQGAARLVSVVDEMMDTLVNLGK